MGQAIKVEYMKPLFHVISILLLTGTHTFANGPQEKRHMQSNECDFSQYKYVQISDHNIPAITIAEPEYPPIAIAAKITGTVQVRILVDKEGNVKRACAATGHPILKEAAVRAARKWRFSRNFGTRSRWKINYVQEWIVFGFGLNLPGSR